MSCVVMYQPYPASSPYLLPSAGPPGPSPGAAVPPGSGHELPPTLSGFVPRIPSNPSAVHASAATVTPPVNSPQSPSSHHQHQQQHHHHPQQQQQQQQQQLQQQQQRLPPTNGLPHGIEPKIEKNLDIGPPPAHSAHTAHTADAYGQMLAAAAAAASRGSSEVATAVAQPHSPSSTGVPSSNSRPGSAHHVQHRRDSEHEQQQQQLQQQQLQQQQQQHQQQHQHPEKSVEHQELEHRRQTSPSGHSGHYPTNNPVVITNYDGAAEGAVDEHFQRALSYNNPAAAAQGGSGGGQQQQADTNAASGEKVSNPTPLNQRGLPASFWQIPQPNLNGANSSGGSAGSGHHGGGNTWPEIYSDQLQQQAAVLNQLGPEWQYLSAQSAHSGYASARSAAAHYSNYSRFHQQPAFAAAASSHWAAASRLAASQVKGEWAAGDYQATAAAALSSAAGLHAAAGSPVGDIAYPYGSAAASAAIQHYSNMTGLETSMQDTSKELYWHGATGF